MRYYSQAVDYLGFLSAKLRDLRGSAILANELIQNADDATGAKSISFDVSQEALIVENDGLFTDCGRVGERECPWKGAKGYKCDFHRFRGVASGDKRDEAGTTGAFGIGFIAVYQITDRPELISSGRHWTIRPEEAEERRIEEELVMNGSGTRFYLSWASTRNTTIRKELRAEPVNLAALDGFAEELSQALPDALLFLRKIERIELKRNGHVFKAIQCSRRENCVEITDGTATRAWHLFQGSFEEEARAIREKVGIRQIEEKRRANVTVAIPESCIGVEGLLYATLPTQHQVGLPLNINADFFPSSDRKRILFDDDYQGRWNKAAVSAAADALAAALQKLPGLLNHRDLWNLISRMHSVAKEARKGQRDAVLEDFWRSTQREIPDAKVVFTSKGCWQSLKSVFLLAAKEEEQECLPVLEALGLEITHADLRTHHNLLLELGVRQFGPADLANALKGAGLNKMTPVANAPAWLRDEKTRPLLAREVEILLKRQPSGVLQTARKELAGCAIALTNDGCFCPPQNLWRAPSETLKVFEPLEFIHTFAAQENAEAINDLVPLFNVQAAVNLLSQVSSETFKALWQADPQILTAIVDWFAEHRADLRSNKSARDQLRRLPIWPSGGSLHILDNLAVPGSFDDPLNLASIVDLNALKGHRDFLIEIGAKPLTVTTYALQHVPKAFSSGREITADGRRRLLIVLAIHLGELHDNGHIREALSRCQIVECKDGSFRLAGEVYATNPEVFEVLGTDIPTAVLPKAHRDAVGALLRWLGVSSVPRSADIIERIKALTTEPPAGDTRVAIQRIFLHLARRWRDHEVTESQFELLKTLAWLPARGDSQAWRSPVGRALYAPYRSYLFESQAVFLDITTREPVGEFLKFLGIEEEPATRLVVNHLLKMAAENREVNKEVYRFLNDKADQPEVEHLRGRRVLLLHNGAVSHYVRADQVFWGKHPFGPYRYVLNPELRAYGRLFSRLNVRESPEPGDSILVLQEIAERFGTENKPLDAEAYGVVIQCWTQLSSGLEQRAVTADQLSGLCGQKVIPDARTSMRKPGDIFFEDRHGLAGKFADILNNNAIPRPQGAAQAMEAAGVRPLSKAVEADLIECDDPVTDDGLIKRILQRRTLLDRVIEAQRASGATGWDTGIISLDVKRVAQLQVRYTLNAFGQVHKSHPETVSVYYDPELTVMYYQEKDGAIPWSALARELAYAFNPEAEPGQVAPGLKEVLSAGSTAEAEEVLNDLGYAPLEVIEVSGQFSEELMDIGGTEGAGQDYDTPADGGGAHSDAGGQQEADKGQKDRRPGEPIKNLPGENVPGPTTPHSGSGMGKVTGLEKPSGGGSTDGSKEKPSPRPQRGRLRTYTVPAGATAEPGSGGAQSEANSRVDRAGVMRVLDFEKREGRHPAEMPHNHPGYDIESSNDAPIIERYIEVKSTNGDWGTLGVGLTYTQFKAAQELKDRYWLYVVERAEHDDARIIRIQNPACRVDQFLYDDGWRDLLEESTGGEETDSIVKG